MTKYFVGHFEKPSTPPASVKIGDGLIEHLGEGAEEFLREEAKKAMTAYRGQEPIAVEDVEA